MYCFNNYLLTVLLFGIIVMITYMLIMMHDNKWMTYKNYSSLITGVPLDNVEVKEWRAAPTPIKQSEDESNDFFGYNLEYYSDKKKYNQMDSFFELSPASNVKSVPKPRNTIT